MEVHPLNKRGSSPLASEKEEMPKKIKKRSKKSEEVVEAQQDLVLRDEEGLPISDEEMDEVANFGEMVVDIPEHERDAFQEINYKAANWIEGNRPMAIGLFAVLVLLPFIGYGAWYMYQQQQVDASAQVSQALQAYRYPVKDSPQMQLFEQNDELKKPPIIYESNTQKWEAVYKSADAALKNHEGGDLGVSAAYSKASAAYQLGKYEEAVGLYKRVIKDERAASLKPFATLAMAMSLAGKGDVDAASSTFDELAALDDAYKPMAHYHKARVLESAGKSKEAKEAYHKLLEETPETTYKSDVERRLATM